VDEYWARLQETRALVAGLEGAAPGIARPRLLEEADRWEAVTQLALPDGTVVPVDTVFLVTPLRADPPNPERLSGLLDALLAAHAAWPQPQAGPADGTLARILARPEFQWPLEQPSPLEEWLWRLQERLLTRLLGNGTVGSALLLRYLLPALAALALLAVLAYSLRGLFAGFVAEAETDAGESGDEDLTVAMTLKRAQDLSAGGDYRAAVRYLYLSSLLLLEERGLLRYDRSRTNREYLRSIAHRPDLAHALCEVVEVFERAWYGYQPLDETSYTCYATRVADLRQYR
jgi:hypothetical protein